MSSIRCCDLLYACSLLLDKVPSGGSEGGRLLNCVRCLAVNETQRENNFSSEFEKKFQIEFQRLQIAKTKILLRQNVTSLQTKESIEFQSTLTLSNRLKIVFDYVLSEAAQRKKDAMMLKKHYIVTNSTLYMSKSLREFEIFKLTCMNIFDVKSIIYEKSIAKI